MNLSEYLAVVSSPGDFKNHLDTYAEMRIEVDHLISYIQDSDVGPVLLEEVFASIEGRVNGWVAIRSVEFSMYPPNTAERRIDCIVEMGFSEEIAQKMHQRMRKQLPSHRLSYWQRVSDHLSKNYFGFVGGGKQELPSDLVQYQSDVDETWRKITDSRKRLLENREHVAVKGLVVGHVQSGKTLHMTGLTARAIDAGVNLIIILAGSTDSLRQQTQFRFDQDLVGLTSEVEAEHRKALAKSFRPKKYLPARVDDEPQLLRVTTSTDDFISSVNLSAARTKGLQVQNLTNQPTLIVVKKEDDQLAKLYDLICQINEIEVNHDWRGADAPRDAKLPPRV
jgi:hypothetical protein